ncbi:MAG: HRDC domain-containing protein [Actinomycetota bacterium]|nr:HRDC domain-containing protein [Actinomycetota bacterium]
MEVRLVDEPAEVMQALTAVDAPTVGVDVERADGHRYVREAALVQVGVAGCCIILDPLALDDLEPLASFLRGRLTVLHALENDLEPLASAGATLVDDQGTPAQLADTAIAAAVLGLPTGLAPLLEQVLGVRLSGDKARYQRADWSRRPLTDDMLAYAAGDVVHLPRLWEALSAQLDDLARTSWYQQELAATVEHVPEQARSWGRTRGLGRLDGHGRAVLRAVWDEREAIAREEDLAPQRVARDDTLIAIAADPPATLSVLRRRGLDGRQLREHGHRLLAAIRRGASSPDEPSPSGLRRADDDDRAAHDRMRRARARVADELGVDPGFLCPGRVLWTAALSDPSSPDELVEAAGLRPWQRELLADVLWEAYTGT